MADRTTLHEKPEDPDETESDAEETGEGGQPFTGHVPIECDIVNLNFLDAVSFTKRTGKKLRGFRETETEGVGGSQFRVTLTLISQLEPNEAPLTVNIRYTAMHGGAQKPSGLFLYKQTDSVTFRANEPNHGNRVQSFPLQTIRFSPELASHDAEITINLYIEGKHVNKNLAKFILKPGP